MEHYTPAVILISGFLFDLVLGDPNYRYHPVRIIGSVIAWLHNYLKYRPWNLRLSGVLLTLLTILISVSAYALIVTAFYQIHPTAAILINIYFVYSLIAH
jgi:adenosylcobinamide-phosphate synthase